MSTAHRYIGCVPSKLITFEIASSGEALEIHLNNDGIVELIRTLERLRALPGDQHDHLKTPAWGGTELTEEKQGTSTKLLNSVKAFLWRAAS